MKYVPGAFNAAMAEAEGPFGRAAAHLDWDDDLRAEAAALLIACLLQPGHAIHADALRRDTGSPPEEFVAKHTPEVGAITATARVQASETVRAVSAAVISERTIYYAQRLDAARPDLGDRVLAGELSMRAACIEAGIIRSTTTWDRDQERVEELAAGLGLDPDALEDRG